jgi:hypothetical protein
MINSSQKTLELKARYTLRVTGENLPFRRKLLIKVQ